jgi:CRP/FNR family transcriptional regulator, cyclic AMP receptor protein
LQRPPEFARIRSCLARSAHFSALPAKDLDRIASLGRRVQLDDGRLLHQAGARPDTFWIVLSGALRIASSGEDGDEFVYAVLGEGSFFGLGYVLVDAPLGVSARAYGATEVAAMDATRFTALLDQTPGLWRHVARLMTLRLSVAMFAIRDISHAPLAQRIVRRLVGQALGRTTDAGAPVEVRVTQSDLAVMLGASRSKVNSELRSLQRDGLIKLGYRAVVLRDLPRLRTLAGPDVFAF